MPRKNKYNSKHGRYMRPNYHSQNKQEAQKASKKVKLRTSLDIYKRLMHDRTLGIDLSRVYIGYRDRERIAETRVLDWIMIDDGGDIPMHRISYFVFYFINDERIILWDKQAKLDRLFCSGETNKATQSIRTILLHHNHSQVEMKHDTYQCVEKRKNTNLTTKKSNCKQSTLHNKSVMILDELIAVFHIDCNQIQPQFGIKLHFNKKRVFQEPILHQRLRRNEYKIIAAATIKIMDQKYFVHPNTTQRVSIKDEMQYSYEESDLYLEKDAFRYMNIDKHKLRKYKTMDIEINHETTLDCAYRLSSKYGTDINMAMLNFSSARNPGGGWDTGAIAQEESIARSSALIPTIKQYEMQFYEYHKRHKSMLYSHALIYSPKVVIMKHGNGAHIERDDGYYKCNIITSPAVNAKNYVKRAMDDERVLKKYGVLDKIRKGECSIDTAAWYVVECVMRERCKRVLELAMKYDNEYVILGAWGCGVFGNDAMIVARIFAELLRDRYSNVFRKVVFAILDDKRKPIDKFIYQFQKVFGNENKMNSNNDDLDTQTKFAYDVIQ